jgi:hypothetical protein
MACPPILKLCKGCWTTNAGSETELYLIDIKNVDKNTIVGATSGYITGASFSADWVKIELTKNSAFSTQTKETNVTNGGGLHTVSIQVTLPFREVDKRNAIASYSAGLRDLWIATKDGNGKGWLYGYERGLNLTNIQIQSSEDLNTGSQYVLTFTGMENQESHGIDLDLILNNLDDDCTA